MRLSIKAGRTRTLIRAASHRRSDSHLRWHRLLFRRWRIRLLALATLYVAISGAAILVPQQQSRHFISGYPSFAAIHFYYGLNSRTVLFGEIGVGDSIEWLQLRPPSPDSFAVWDLIDAPAPSSIVYAGTATVAIQSPGLVYSRGIQTGVYRELQVIRRDKEAELLPIPDAAISSVMCASVKNRLRLQSSVEEVWSDSYYLRGPGEYPVSRFSRNVQLARIRAGLSWSAAAVVAWAVALGTRTIWASSVSRERWINRRMLCDRCNYTPGTPGFDMCPECGNRLGALAQAE